MGLPSSATALDRIRGGAGQQLTPSRRLTPSRNELIQQQQIIDQGWATDTDVLIKQELAKFK